MTYERIDRKDQWIVDDQGKVTGVRISGKNTELSGIVTSSRNPLTGWIDLLLDQKSIPFGGTSIAFYGDSLVENSSSYLTPISTPVQSLGAGFAVKGTELNCPAGDGTLTYSGATKTLTWAAFGESAGVATDASKTGLIYVPSGVAAHGIYLDWFGATRTYTSGSVVITARAAGFNLRQYQSSGFCYVAMAFSRQCVAVAPFADDKNGNEAFYGLGGGRSDELLSAYWQWGNIKSTIAVLCIGQNDAPSSLTASQTIDNIKALVAKINAKKIIICTLPPRNGDSADQKKGKQLVNTWIYSYCAGSTYLYPFDLYGYLADTTTGDFLAAYSTDSVHPNGNGCISAGRPLGALIRSLVGDVSVRRPSYLDMYNATTNPSGSLFPTAGMSTFEGSSGTAGTGASGVIPTGWRVRRTTGSAMTAVGSKVAYTDKPGSQYQVTLASSAASEVVRIDVPTGLLSGIAVGDVVEAQLVCTVVSSTGLSKLQLSVYDNGSTTQVASFANRDGIITDFTGQVVIKTPKWTIPVGFTSLSFLIDVGVEAGGSAVIGFDSAAFNKVVAA
jgi:hypothetical protein